MSTTPTFEDLQKTIDMFRDHGISTEEIKKQMNREFKYIGLLPIGYEYKIVELPGSIRIIGVSHDKPPIGFIMKNGKLEEIKLEP